MARILIKLGGSILYSVDLISSLCANLKSLKQAGFEIILIHGGSKAINYALQVYQISSVFKNGLRVTTPQAMQIIEMVLCGQVNKQLVRSLNKIGVAAVGLSGMDDNLLQCDYISDELGCAGTVKAINSDVVNHLLAFKDCVPTIAPVGVDHQGNAMNVNADVAACHLAYALKVNKLIYLTDQEGIYNQKGEIFDCLSANDLQGLIDNEIVTAGMLVKTQSILTALKHGISSVRVLNGQHPDILLSALLYEDSIGTNCVPKVLEETLS